MPHRFTPDEVRDIKAAHAAGEGATSIAKRYGCPKSTVQYHTNPRQIAKAVEKHATSKRPQRTIIIRKCPICPLLFTTVHGGKVYCTEACRLESARRDMQEKIDEFLWIAGTDSWSNIARRLGFRSVDSLGRWLNRAGEHAWASRATSSGMPRTYARAA
jgi:hypothetical protein